MKEYFYLLKTAFISRKGTISSKRLIGFLMITMAGFLILLAGLKNTDYNVNLTSLIRDLIYGGVALVGSTIFEKKFKIDENDTGDK
jgi:hypothetical protein